MRKLLLLGLVLIAQPASAQVTFTPGQSRENIAAAGIKIKDEKTGPLGSTALSFTRLDSQTQAMLMLSGAASSGIFTGPSSAALVGRLVYDFCVPRQGETTCDAVPDPNAPTIAAKVMFEYGFAGGVAAFGLGTKSSFRATGSILDMDANKLVHVLELANMASANGTIKPIAGYPIPLPDFEGESVTAPVTFTTLLKRGKVYRFQLSAETKASTTGILAGEAFANFANLTLPAIPRCFVALRNLSIHVESDPTGDLQLAVKALQETVSSLQEQIGSLTDQITTIVESFEETAAALQAQIAEIPAGAPGPPGPAGPVGPVGPAGPAGPKGDGLMIGSLLFLPARSLPPEGYRFIGRFDLDRDRTLKGRPREMEVDVYKKLRN